MVSVRGPVVRVGRPVMCRVVENPVVFVDSPVVVMPADSVSAGGGRQVAVNADRVVGVVPVDPPVGVVPAKAMSVRGGGDVVLGPVAVVAPVGVVVADSAG